MLTQLVRSILNETATCAPDGFSAGDGQHSVNAVRLMAAASFLTTFSFFIILLSSALAASAASSREASARRCGCGSIADASLLECAFTAFVR